MSVHQLCTNVHFRPLLNHSLLNVPDIFQTSKNFSPFEGTGIMQHPWCGETYQWTENWPDSWYLMIILPVNSLRMLDPAMQEYAHAANVLMTFTSGKPATNILRPLRGEMSVPWQTWKNIWNKHIKPSKPRNPETQPDLKGLKLWLFFAFAALRLQTFSSLPAENTEPSEPKPWTHYLLLIGVEGRQILQKLGVWPSRVWKFRISVTCLWE